MYELYPLTPGRMYEVPHSNPVGRSIPYVRIGAFASCDDGCLGLNAKRAAQLRQLPAM